MASKARRHGRSKRNRWMLVSAVAIFLVLISVLAYIGSLHQPRPVPIPQKDSSKYFTFSELGAYGHPSGTNNITIVIKQLWFNFTPVEGDAHYVVIFTEGNSDPTQNTFDEISNGTSTYSGDIGSYFGIPASKTAGGYAVKVRIRCTEADGWTTLIIPENSTILTA